MGRRGRDTVQSKPISRGGWPTNGRISTIAEVLSKEWRVWAPHWVPSPEVQHQEDKLPERLALKISRAHFWESQRAVGSSNSILKCVHKISHGPRPTAEAVIWKELKSDPCADLESLSERQEATGAHPEFVDTGSSHFGEFVLPHGYCAGKWYFGILPLSC